MDLPKVIDIAIGLVVFFFLLSTVCSFAVELLATWRGWRKRWLYEAIGRLITGGATCTAPTPPFFPKLPFILFRKESQELAGCEPSLISDELEEPPALVEKLNDEKNPVSELLRRAFDQSAWQEITRLAGESRPARRRTTLLRKLLSEQLNRVIAGPSIFDPRLFPENSLSPESRSLLGRVAAGKVTRRLNRSLLEDAFPNHLKKEARYTTEVLASFWNHPMAKNLAPDSQFPSYLEPSTFATIVVDIAVPGAATGTLPATAEGIERVIELGARSGELAWRPLLAEVLQVYRLRDVNRAPDRPPAAPAIELRAGIERLYDEAMERLGGRYKRKAQCWLFAFGVALSIALNADTIRVVYVLGTDNAIRANVAAFGATLSASTNAVPAPPATNSVTNVSGDGTASVLATGSTSSIAPNSPINLGTNSAPAGQFADLSSLQTSNARTALELRLQLVQNLKELQRLQQMGFPVGWRGEAEMNFTPLQNLWLEPGSWNWRRWLLLLPAKLAGLLATASAVSLGAPFWFDLLNKLVSLRGAGKRIPTSSSESRSGKSTGPALTAAETGASQTAAAGGPASAPAAASIPPSDLAKDLADARLGFDARKAYWSAEVALLAYGGAESVRNALQQWSFDVALMFEKIEAAQGFLAVSTDKKMALLAFRGTEQNLEDWKTDAEFALTDPSSPERNLYGGRTHLGFTSQLGKVYDEIAAKLKSATKDADNRMLLYIVGHSLGAALATLMAARLTREQICGVHAVHTFGSPRVGDGDFVKAYQLELGHCTYRVVHGQDLVTRVPPRLVPVKNWHYDHVGQVVYFDSDGRMHLNTGYWERFLDTVINAVQDFRNTAKAALKDHSMEDYVRLLKKTAGDKG